MNPFGKIYIGKITVLINFIIRLFIRATIFWALTMSMVVVVEFGAMPKNCTNSFLHRIKFI